MQLNGHWDFPRKMGDKSKVGFVYVIKDTYMNQIYIGKKFYRGRGYENYNKEFDWKNYISSSKIVQKLIQNRPKEEFEFIALEEYRTIGGLSYAEVWSILRIKGPERQDCLNKLIDKVSWKSRESITSLHEERIKCFEKS